METIVLGLLMIQNSTIYEMRKAIETNLMIVSSNSMGSIQAAVKKLQEKGMIEFNEFVENSVNKKSYQITAIGKSYFFESISKPMLYKEKNMEISKFFFMGFAEKTKQVELIDAYISELKSQLDALMKLNSNLQPRYNFSADYIHLIHAKGGADEITAETVGEIALFQYATLDLGIAKIQFEIEWFENFKQNLLQERELVDGK